MRRRTMLFVLAFASGLVAVLVAFLTLAGPVEQAKADPGELYVAPGGDCGGASPCYDTVQSAVDAAVDGDLIKVATGVYTGVQSRPAPAGYNGPAVVTQVLYISKTVNIQGGYTTTDWAVSHPLTQPTTLDAQTGGRVIFIAGDISPTVEGLHITGGDAVGLGGASGSTGGDDDDSGGGIYVAAAAVITHNWVFSNTASRILDNLGNYACGGGMFLGDGATILLGNTIFSNTANAGGGVCIEGVGAVLDGNIIRANATSGYENQGGGIHLGRSAATVQGNVIVSNTASMGGGLSLNASSLKLIGNIISYNGDESWGGGVMCFVSDHVEIRENLIASNSGWTGGGLAMGSCEGTLNENTIVANIAAIDGGGLDIGQGSNITLTNNIIAYNETAQSGSGLLIEGSLVRLLHNTIARNAGGGGVHATNLGSGYSIVTITNTILVSHTVGVAVTAGSIATLEGTLWGEGAWANGTDWTGDGTIITGTVNVWDDPAFSDPDAGDYHIAPGSAAIDNGVDAGVLEDIDGDPRPMGGGYDIGADEIVGPALSVAKQATPDVVQAGAPLTYTISLTNTGDVALTAIITDVLPDHVVPSGTLTWTTELPAPGVWTEMVVVTVALGYSGPLTNMVQVATVEGATGVYTTVVQGATPALTVSQWAWPDPVPTGEQLTFTIRVTNTGNVALTVAVTDILPSFVSPAGVLTWTGINLASGAVWEQAVAVTVTFGYEGLLTNIVQVATLEGVTDHSEVSCDVVKYPVYLPLVWRD